MFSSYVQYAHASVMTRARTARIKTRTISVFLICKSQLPLLEKKNDKWRDIANTVLTDLCFSTLKIFSTIIYISMWQRLKTIHRGKLELRKNNNKKPKINKIITCPGLSLHQFALTGQFFPIKHFTSWLSGYVSLSHKFTNLVFLNSSVLFFIAVNLLNKSVQTN